MKTLASYSLIQFANGATFKTLDGPISYNPSGNTINSTPIPKRV